MTQHTSILQFSLPMLRSRHFPTQAKQQNLLFAQRTVPNMGIYLSPSCCLLLKVHEGGPSCVKENSFDMMNRITRIRWVYMQAGSHAIHVENHMHALAMLQPHMSVSAAPLQLGGWLACQPPGHSERLHLLPAAPQYKTEEGSGSRVQDSNS